MSALFKKMQNKNLKIKFQAATGLEPVTSVIPVQRSKPTKLLNNNFRSTIPNIIHPFVSRSKRLVVMKRPRQVCTDNHGITPSYDMNEKTKYFRMFTTWLLHLMMIICFLFQLANVEQKCHDYWVSTLYRFFVTMRTRTGIIS